MLDYEADELRTGIEQLRKDNDELTDALAETEKLSLKNILFR